MPTKNRPPASEMGNGQLLDAFQNAYYQQDQGYTKEDGEEARRYDEYRAELLRRLRAGTQSEGAY